MDPIKTLAPVDIVDAIEKRIAAKRQRESVLTAISGIDASGKSTLARFVQDVLTDRGLRVSLVHLDEWHSPADVRFHRNDWAANYYENAYRFDELFNSLVLPLKRDRSIEVTIDLLDPFRNVFSPRTFSFHDIDIIILEGIFLLKSAYKSFYDLAYWIDCPVEVALARALHRNQEEMPEQQIKWLYNNVLFPAQRIHIHRDKPISLADGVISLKQLSDLKSD